MVQIGGRDEVRRDVRWWYQREGILSSRNRQLRISVWGVLSFSWDNWLDL